MLYKNKNIRQPKQVQLENFSAELSRKNSIKV